MGKVIVVTSGKGGVGKTTSSAALGAALAQNGDKVVVGETATLELEPNQVDIVTLAQKTSSLSLVLRSLQDAGDQNAPASEGGMTLVRYGVTSKGVKP